MQQISNINDFVLRFANVNGTGSASANSTVAKSFFRMGLPIGPKNMFPSNIQGLPTWYEVRVSEKGYTGRRGGVDFMVAMNGQTFSDDQASVVPGGYLLYDSTRHLPPESMRSDITYLGVPLTQMSREHFSNPRQRSLLQNIVYVGAVVALLDIEYEVVCKLLQDQFAKNPKLVEMNILALKIGFDFAKKTFQCPLPIRVARRDLIKDKILIDGNSAAGLGCVYAGATVAAWYPITPSTSLVDAFGKYCAKFRVDKDSGEHSYAIIQAEDELAAIGMVLGASWNGARSFTATSGPGVSLMGEFLGFAYYAEVPVVLFNIQRCGPSTGMPTRTQQADLLSTAYASHGDTRHVMLFPATPTEAFDFAIKAFDLAEMLQTPVIVMSDLDLGMNDWLSEPFKWSDDYKPQRGKVLNREALDKFETKEKFFRYLDVDGDGIPYRTLPGTHPEKGSFFTRGSGHDKFGRYTEDAAAYKDNVDRLRRKLDTNMALLPPPIVCKRQEKGSASARAGLIAFGTSDEAVIEALDILKEKHGIVIDDLRIRSFPFHEEVNAFSQAHDIIFVLEQNRDGQLRAMLTMELGIARDHLLPLLNYDGLPITASWLIENIQKILHQKVLHQKNGKTK